MASFAADDSERRQTADETSPADSRTELAFVGFGANRGDASTTLERAVESLDEFAEVIRVSRRFATAPVGTSSLQFENAVIACRSRVDPFSLLTGLHEIEARLGRVRESRWGDRSIDLDLLAHGQFTIDSDELRLPHPASWYRRFVLDPWADIAPEFRHPTTHRSIGDLQQHLTRRPITMSIAGAATAVWHAMPDFTKGFPDLQLVQHGDTPASSTAIIAWFGAAESDDFLSLPDGRRLNVTDESRRVQEDALSFFRGVVQSVTGWTRPIDR